jgi:hypothetical protein
VADVIANTASVRGQHVITSTVNGRANSIVTPNPGSSIGVWLTTTSAGATGKVLLR